MTVEGLERVAGVYFRFAAREASGRSPLYEELASGVAGDREILAMLAELPPAKQQPNLLLASLRYCCGTPSGWKQASSWLHDRRDEIVAAILSRANADQLTGSLRDAAAAARGLASAAGAA